MLLRMAPERGNQCTGMFIDLYCTDRAVEEMLYVFNTKNMLGHYQYANNVRYS